MALTLTPAMCAMMLKHGELPTKGFFGWFNRQVDAITRGFGHAVEWTIARSTIALLMLVGFLFLIWHFFHVLPTSFVPNEDQGYVMAAIIMPEAASIDHLFVMPSSSVHRIQEAQTTTYQVLGELTLRALAG